MMVRGMLSGLVLLLSLGFAMTNAWAATDVEISIGFKGRVVDQTLTPIHLKISHEGPAIDGKLIFSQTVDTPWRGVLTESLSQPLNLGQRANKEITVYFPINSIVYPLSIQYRNLNDDIVYEESLDLREIGQATPLTIALSETGFPQDLPTGETILKLSPEEVPDRLEGFESIARIYLGRFNVSTLLDDQQQALMQWVMSGGELVVFTGDNWFIQNSDLLTPWLPMQPEGVEDVTLLNGTTVSMVSGEITGEILFRIELHPVLLHQSVGQGRVLMATADVLTLDGIDSLLHLWNLLTPRPRLSIANSFEQESQKLFMDKRLEFPDRFLLAAILFVFAGGTALFTWMSVRKPYAIAGLGVWVIVSAIGATILMQQPQYAKPLTTVEYGLETVLPDGSSVQHIWYGLYSQRGDDTQLLLPETTLFRQQLPQERGQHLYDVAYEQGAESAIWFRSQPQQLRSFQGMKTTAAAMSWKWLEDGVTLEVFSPTGLERAWLLHRGRLLDLGALNAEETVRFSLNALPQIRAERDLPRPIYRFWSWALDVYNTGTLMGAYHQQGQVTPASLPTHQTYHLIVSEAL